MTKTITTVFVCVLTFVFLFGAPNSASSEPPIPTPDVVSLIDNEIIEEFEEYPVEDYFDETYVETECQDCLISAETDGCLEIHADCLELPDCSGWLSCVGWCEAYEADDDCYVQCDVAFIDRKSVQVDLHVCACEMCAMQCRTLCGVTEGY